MKDCKVDVNDYKNIYKNTIEFLALNFLHSIPILKFVRSLLHSSNNLNFKNRVEAVRRMLKLDRQAAAFTSY